MSIHRELVFKLALEDGRKIWIVAADRWSAREVAEDAGFFVTWISPSYVEMAPPGELPFRKASSGEPALEFAEDLYQPAASVT